MMTITPEEQEAIKTVLRLADEHGHGNLISHLRTHWAMKLIGQGMTPSNAKLAAHTGTIYPFRMQHDILLRGEWDETGERYKGDD